LLDFDFDSVDIVPSSDAGKPVVIEPLSALEHNAQDSVDMLPSSDAGKPVVTEPSFGLVHSAHDYVDMMPSSQGYKSVVHQLLPEVVLGAQIDCGNVWSAENTLAFAAPQSAVKPVKSLPIYQSWIGDLPRGVQRHNTPAFTGKAKSVCN